MSSGSQGKPFFLSHLLFFMDSWLVLKFDVLFFTFESYSGDFIHGIIWQELCSGIRKRMNRKSPRTSTFRLKNMRIVFFKNIFGAKVKVSLFFFFFFFFQPLNQFPFSRVQSGGGQR